MVSGFVNLAVEYIFPKFCVGCKQEGFWLCDFCKSNVEQIEDFKIPQIKNTVGSFAGFSFHDPKVSKIIKLLKYSGATDLYLTILDLFLLVAIKKIGFRDNYIFVPVPLSRRRFLERGFNQASLLAGAIVESLGNKHKIIEDLILRKNAQKNQAELSKAERVKNVEQVFSINSASFANFKTKLPSVVIIDDVATTGATISAVAGCLKNAGFTKIYSFTFAFEE